MEEFIFTSFYVIHTPLISQLLFKLTHFPFILSIPQFLRRITQITDLLSSFFLVQFFTICSDSTKFAGRYFNIFKKTISEWVLHYRFILLFKKKWLDEVHDSSTRSYCVKSLIVQAIRCWRTDAFISKVTNIHKLSPSVIHTTTTTTKIFEYVLCRFVFAHFGIYSIFNDFSI